MTASKTLTMTVGDIVTSALKSARIIGAEQSVTAPQYADGLDAVNTISKYWQTQGVHLWLDGRAVLALNPGQKAYSLGPEGDPIGVYEDYAYTTLTSAAVISATTLTVASTTGMVAAADVMSFDPTDSTQNWTALNSATLAIASGLRITNVGATQGGATYSLETVPGQTYRVRFSYTKGTSASAIFTVLNASTVASTVTLSVTGSSFLDITASGETIVFKFQNSSSTAGQTSTVFDLAYVDTESGSVIGVQLDAGTRDWDYVYTVDSATSVTMISGLLSAAASGNTVYSFPEQIDRPLSVANVSFSSAYENSEIPVSDWSRQEYFEQPDKGSEGSVVQWYYDPKLTNGLLYVWQTASNINNILRFDYRIPLSVYSDVNDELDMAEEYFLAMQWAIAAELGPAFGVNESRQMVIEAKAAKFLQEALDNDSEGSAMYFQPDMS